ncbi:DUF2779 domain-containing protein [Leptospira sp. GIMC2001]|uniref:DUF2779 domain-containing protein n=1 Tax=Leptospira sp. GIMC2001 TaxID=1513297 RepID=UPI002349E4C8|nr:DUF2779 domain-containing protein [Leptospira sp. GIMC2001]WCL49285.1 DUF2779 domain-containing protein [Leptospira sp. GIMC2001]
MTDPKPSFRFITKSKLLNLNRCENLFRFNLLYKDQRKVKSFEENFGLENDRVRALACSQYPEGIHIPKYGDIQLAAIETRRNLELFKTIFHPVLIYEDLISSPDMLIHIGDGVYDVWEISTSINTKRDFELSFAYHKKVLEFENIKINRYMGIKINSEYELDGDLDLSNFFITKDFSDKLLKHSETIELLINQIRQIRDGQEVSTPKSQCQSYKVCSYTELCFPNLDSGDIFTLRESAKTAVDLYHSGIFHLKDIPDNTELSDKQKIQIATSRSNLPHQDTNNISLFLDRLKFPIYYLDFETINPQIPFYQKSKPYQHIPFLFSLHKWNGDFSTEPEHFDYIQEDFNDPRPGILKQLSKIIEPGGTILCFNDFFEKRCLQESTQAYPEYKSWFESIRSFFLDAAIPFKSLDYYSPDQHGSASLKDILPALTGASHSHLDIQNGHAANLEYLKLIRTGEENLEVKKIIWNRLREYCKMDTYALYLIHKKLTEIVNQK